MNVESSDIRNQNRRNSDSNRTGMRSRNLRCRVREGSDWYLRAYIDKEGGVDINDCEKVNRALSAKMDEYDFIDDAYILEVSSPGLGRTLKKEKHFMKSMGEEVEVKLYKAIEKEKQFVGILKSYQDGNIVIETDKKEMEFQKADIASVRLTFDF